MKHTDTKLEDLDPKTRAFMKSDEGLNALWNRIGHLSDLGYWNFNWIAELAVEVDKLKNPPEEPRLSLADIKALQRKAKHHHQKLRLFRDVRGFWASVRTSERRKGFARNAP